MFEKEFRVYQINSKFIFVETIEKNAKDILDFFNDTDVYINMPTNGINSTYSYEVNDSLDTERDEEFYEEENEERIEEVDDEERSSQEYPIASYIKEPPHSSKRKFRWNRKGKRLTDSKKSSNAKSCGSTERSDSNLSLAENLVPENKLSKAQRLEVGYVLQGTIKYFNDPSLLWIEINNRDFSVELDKWCTQVESLYDPSELSKIGKGELACYYLQKLKEWVRVRVEEMYESEMGVADIRQRECLISTIDCGGHLKVKLGELRKCLPSYLNIQPNCIKAYLHYLKPYTSNEKEKEGEEKSKWSHECGFLMKAWIEYFDYTVKVSSRCTC